MTNPTDQVNQEQKQQQPTNIGQQTADAIKKAAD